MSRDEKRSDDEIRADLGLVASFDVAPLLNAPGACARLISDVGPLLAALAAAREDSERVGEWINDYKREQEAIIARWMDEAAAVRVEVTQLQARIEGLCVEFADEAIDAEPAWHAEPSGEFARSQALRWAANRLRAALAEPLGSTEDPPAEGSSE